MPRKKGDTRDKADGPTHEARVTDVLRLRVEGAHRREVIQYVTEKEQEPNNPWTLGKRGRPLCESAVGKYITRADAERRRIAANMREEAFDRHLVARGEVYARAIIAGDLSNALGALRDEAKLLDLYPADRKEISGAGGGPIEFMRFESATDATPTPAALPPGD